MAPPLLDVRNLSVSYPAPSGSIQAVREVSFQLAEAEALALVGETGCGKSTISLSLLGLLKGTAHSSSDGMWFGGKDLSNLRDREWREIRGREIGLVFQDARGSLNPVLTVGAHLLETIKAHRRMPRRQVRQEAERILADVGIPDPGFHMRRYPFELSGGLCQRVGIALAICNQPRLLIADEPTSSLDPTIQAQILLLLREMSRRHGMALLLISHDLPLVAEFADRVAVMYHGRLVEVSPAQELFRNPAHPYTRGLIQSQPGPEHNRDSHPLGPIPGAPPRPGAVIPGCAFAPRCHLAEKRCAQAVPPPIPVSENHWAACVLADQGRESRP